MVTLSLEQRVWGAKDHLPLPCRLVTFVRKNFGTGKCLGLTSFMGHCLGTTVLNESFA